MRVAMISQGFHPQIGGAQRQLLALGPRLRRLGVDVHIVTRRHPGMSAFETVEDLPVHRMPIPGPKAVASAAFTAGATRCLRRLRPDVIHAHELLSPTTTAVLAGSLLSIPVVAKVLISGEVGYLRDERPLGRQRMAVFRRRIAAFIAISQEIDEELARSGIPADRRRLIPNGVDTERYAPTSADRRAALRGEFGLGDGPAVVYLGRLEEQKNLQTLLSVWNRVRAVHPDAELLLAGEGSQRAALSAAAGPGVRFLGSCPKVADLLAAADLFVLPSWQEGLSNALLEAMACGLPVVATAVGGAPEVVEHGRSGWLVDPGDPDSIETALRKLLDDPALRARLGASARERIVARYALDDRAHELHDLYREVMR